MVVSFVFTIFLQLVLSEDAGLCVKENPSSDGAFLVQLQVLKELKTCARTADNMCLAELSDPCDDYCGIDGCDLDAMQKLDLSDIFRLLGDTCAEESAPPGTAAAPYVEGPVCYFPGEINPPTCDAFSTSDQQRVCVCKPTMAGTEDGDPHIRSLRGAHYTLQQGIFTAWSFSQVMQGVEWQLLAAYSGQRFTTQGLMLLDKHSGKSLEIMADDCSWRIKEEAWRTAGLEFLSSEDGATTLQIQQLHEQIQNSTILKSAILLRMDSEKGMRNVAKLVVHCSPQKHMDFKVGMFEKNDINHVGGELGLAADAKSDYHVLFTKKHMMEMKTDSEFKVPKTWTELGGRPAAAAYLSQQAQSMSLLQTSCSEREEADAKAICSKHLNEDAHPVLFADCVFDLCHGGDESFAQSAAALISA